MPPFSLIEPLEARIAPAFTLHFMDADGDAVTVQVSRGTEADAELLFDPSGTTLQKLGLNDPVFLGANVSITAKATSIGGDGRADVGWLEMQFAPGETRVPSLGKVTVDGDLAKLTIGAIRTLPNDRLLPDAGIGIKHLSVGSMGMFGTATGAPDLLSDVRGSITQMQVAGDLREVQVRVSGEISSLKVTGDLIGGAEGFSGSVLTGRDIGRATIQGDLVGGAGDRSGALFSGEDFRSLFVGGSLLGGDGWQSGHLDALRGHIGTVRVNGSLVGGAGPESGAISSELVRGILLGEGGAITATAPGVFLNELNEAGTDVGSVWVGGSVTGTGIFSLGTLGSVQVRGSVFDSIIYTGSTVRSIFVGGSFEASKLTANNLGRLTIGGDAAARSGFGSTEITLLNELKHLAIGGDLRAELPDARATLIIGGGRMETFHIGGSIDGGYLYVPELKRGKIGGDIRGGSLARTGSVNVGIVGTFAIGGSLIAGTGDQAGDLQVVEVRGSLSIAGDLEGRPDQRLTLRGGQATAAKIVIGGTVRHADILFGYGATGKPETASTHVSNVIVRGDWIASNLAVGVKAGDDGQFGTADDLRNGLTSEGFPPTLARFEIQGRVLGTTEAGENFGIVAGRIGKLIVDGRRLPLTPGEANDDFNLGTLGNVRVREVPPI